MNLKFNLSSLRRRTLLLVVVVAMSVAMLPTAAFASGYGHQGRGWDPGPRQSRGEHRPAQDNDRRGNDQGPWNPQNSGPNSGGGQWNDNNHQPDRCDTTYRVRRGDSLSEIARHFGVSVQALSKANGIKNPNRIYAGQVLCIPC